jgi:hypothetical protein
MALAVPWLNLGAVETGRTADSLAPRNDRARNESLIFEYTLSYLHHPHTSGAGNRMNSVRGLPRAYKVLQMVRGHTRLACGVRRLAGHGAEESGGPPDSAREPRALPGPVNRVKSKGRPMDC